MAMVLCRHHLEYIKNVAIKIEHTRVESSINNIINLTVRLNYYNILQLCSSFKYDCNIRSNIFFML